MSISQALHINLSLAQISLSKQIWLMVDAMCWMIENRDKECVLRYVWC